MRIWVIGAGAVGSWLAGHLARAGADVFLVARGERAGSLAARGLTVHRQDETFTLLPALSPSVSAAAREGPGALALVCVKSYHTDEVARELAAARPAAVVCFQNGVGNEASTRAVVPATPVVAATLTTGVWIDGAGAVHGRAAGGIGLEAWPGADPLAGALGAGGLTVRRYPDAAAMKWSKLLLNLLGSATSALLDWPTGRVFSDRRLFHLELTAWREALAVLRAEGLRPVNLPGFPVDLYASLGGTLPETFLFHTVAGRLAGGRGDRRTGLATDLAAGRADSEVTVLHGAVAAAGARHTVPTPVCAALTALVLQVARGERPRAELVDRPAALLEAVQAYGGSP